MDEAKRASNSMQPHDRVLQVGVYSLSPVYEIRAGSMYLGTITKIADDKFHAVPNKVSSYVREFESLEVAAKWLGFKGGVNPVDPTVKANQDLTKG